MTTDFEQTREKKYILHDRYVAVPTYYSMDSTLLLSRNKRLKIELKKQEYIDPNIDNERN